MAISFFSKQTFKSRAEQAIEEFKLDGGLNTDISKYKLPGNYALKATNVVVAQQGAIETRPGYSLVNNGADTTSGSISSGGSASGYYEITSAANYVAQTFAGANVKHMRVDVTLAIVGSGSQPVRVEIWSTATGVPDELLYTGPYVYASSTSATAKVFNFDIDNLISLAAGTDYAVVVKIPYLAAGVTAVRVSKTDAAYAGGSLYESANEGASWTSAAGDLLFGVHRGAGLPTMAALGLFDYLEPDTNTYRKLYFRSNGSAATGATYSFGYLDTWDYPATINNLVWTEGPDRSVHKSFDAARANDGTLLIAHHARVTPGFNNVRPLIKFRRINSTVSAYNSGAVNLTQGDKTVVVSTGATFTNNVAAGQYMSLPNGLFYRVAEVSSNTSLELDVAYPLTSVTGASYKVSSFGYVFGQLDSPTLGTSEYPKGDYIESHRNRIWVVSKEGQLWWSALATAVDSYYDDWSRAGEDGAGEIVLAQKATVGDNHIMGMVSLNDVLYIFRRTEILAVRGDSPSNFEVSTISADVGSVSNASIVPYKGSILFLSDRDIYTYDGANLRALSESKVGEYIRSIGFGLNTSNELVERFVNAVLWNDHYIVTWQTVGADGYRHGTSLCLNLVTGSFSVFDDMPIGVWVTLKGTLVDSELYFAAPSGEYIYKWAQDASGNPILSDAGYDITSTYETPKLSPATPMAKKSLKKFYAQFDTETSTRNPVTVTQILDDDDETSVALTMDDSPLNTHRVGEFQGMTNYVGYRFVHTDFEGKMRLLGILVTARERRL